MGFIVYQSDYEIIQKQVCLQNCMKFKYNNNFGMFVLKNVYMVHYPELKKTFCECYRLQSVIAILHKKYKDKNNNIIFQLKHVNKYETSKTKSPQL